jgi:hypothetical protein
VKFKQLTNAIDRRIAKNEENKNFENYYTRVNMSVDSSMKNKKLSFNRKIRSKWQKADSSSKPNFMKKNAY